MSSLKDSLRRTKEKMLRPSSRNEIKVQTPATPPLEYDQTEQLDSEPAEPPITLAVIGAGQRGKRYASYALANPKLCKVVAVAEPREKTREIFAKNHSIPETGIFNSYDDLLAASQKLREETGKRIADATFYVDPHPI
ncbi:hypothetical protein M407DRAFT_33953 [Tulasnella calospora MUT 4182]|uniref:Gfo/Idh/MocA-like oxidoreductase N-terminal domain-containing protein n=1 Tax=Tulasnella calospora MUT 4182 TaxID=1051891 RepID=A0A0C3K4U7_9AGAM|nr:hypothetical protein M407DRAFT_33953 [Tulasnella calospora MUT 4182]